MLFEQKKGGGGGKQYCWWFFFFYFFELTTQKKIKIVLNIQKKILLYNQNHTQIYVYTYIYFYANIWRYLVKNFFNYSKIVLYFSSWKQPSRKQISFTFILRVSLVKRSIQFSHTYTQTYTISLYIYYIV